ncbi:MAG: glucosaminidase domain-containing protein [Cellvibrionaceae bacterium]
MTHSTHSKAWLGYLFLFYAAFCIALPYFLIHWWPSQLPKPQIQQPKAEAPTRSSKAEKPVNIAEMKQAFFEKLVPVVKSENQKNTKQRQRLLSLYTGLNDTSAPLNPQQQALLQSLAIQYRVPAAMDDQALLEQLLVRVDQVPASMVIAQAAIESAWGRSRFALEANNYFGQWCFTQGCGVVPKRRNSGASHEVAKFNSIDAAVAAYLRNINSHPAYAEVRQKRLEARQQQRQPDSLEMIQGLAQYSARGEKYIEELQSLIGFNRLQRFDTKDTDFNQSANAE